MGKLNKTCLVCNKQYHHCYSCPTDLQHPSWMELFDKENCKNIFNILSRHGQKMIINEEAKELLNQCDLSQKDNFADNIKNHINQIFCIDVNEEINEEQIVENVVENIEEEITVSNETVVEEVVEEETTENTTTILPRYKNNKKNNK